MWPGPGSTSGVQPLTTVCQETIMRYVELCNFNPRLINDIAKRLVLLEHLLEPILNKLVIKNVVTDVAFLAFLNRNRRSLDIPGLSGIRNSTLKLIGYNCSGLISLDASNCAQMSNSIVRCVLQGCELLEVLCLDGCPRISDAAFDPSHCPFDRFKAVDVLKTISLRRCGQITGSCALVLQKSYRNLRDLFLSQCKQILSSYAIDFLMHRTLQVLDLSFVDSIGADPFPDGDQEPQNKPPRTPSSVCPTWSISNLYLSQSRITDQNLGFISKRLRNLVSIRLQWCAGISDCGISLLVENCDSLKFLNLQSCNISDVSLAAVSDSCTHLEDLDISWCSRVTDAGVLSLATANTQGKLLRFRSLKASWCPEVTDESIVELPNLVSFQIFESSSYSMSSYCRQKLEQSGIEVKTELLPSAT